MRLLVAGASGFLGRYVVWQAVENGHNVIALTRSHGGGDWSDSEKVKILHCDLSSEALNLSGMDIDEVIHLAASMQGTPEQQRSSTIDGTYHLLHAMRQAGIHNLVGVSSLSVVDYDVIPGMSTVDESSPKYSDSQQIGLYAAMKLEQEQMMVSFAAEAGNQCVILRPGLIYDDTHLIAASAGIIKGPLKLLASHGGQVPVVSVRSVASAILNAIEHDVDSGEIIHLVDDKLPGQQQYNNALRRRNLLGEGGLTISWKLLHAMVSILYGIARLFGLQRKLPEIVLPKSFAARLKPFRFSNTKAKNMLYWTPSDNFH